MTAATEKTFYDESQHQLVCKGDWDIANMPALQTLFHAMSLPKEGEITVNGEAISKMDSAGAWMLNGWVSQLEKKGMTVRLLSLSKQHQELLNIVDQTIKDEEPLPAPIHLAWVARVGQQTLQAYDQFLEYLSFIGKLTYEALRVASRPSHLRWGAFSSVLYRSGYQALPIIALLSMLIGVVITYQMGLQLKNYGANIFIVDLLGLSILREFGPLITAIMVAGRTGSAFTAQIGMMKLNQEVDALDTMGVTPAELLLLPRIVGLFIALPLLTMWADIFGVLGGMVMSSTMLSISWYDFLHRFPNVIHLKTLLLGLGKAPVFALVIASIGCFQGMKVEGGADSVGLNTTRSVVLSIFFIIVADALFSVIFSELKL